jgi:hypothetical protein
MYQKAQIGGKEQMGSGIHRSPERLKMTPSLKISRLRERLLNRGASEKLLWL